ncbi:hypothetical protein [Ereboglobus luteus]|uniref:Uncharacterized protein n=1 Tax=Ereboglobus luteus TaxID=1796921 RepID=A0A2U8E1A6_9BACT|nr:hypothetical protein [Ereboglobus luteus]AWI08565.1 hypothetical protein CKA38_04235 [Ereboglobus luteus]
MKIPFAFTLAAALAAIPLFAGCASRYKTQPSEPAPVTSVTTVAAPQNETVRADNQRLYGTEGVPLPQYTHAAEIINEFRPVYEKLGKPRFVFYINRDLKGKARPSSKTHSAKDKLADKQTARDIERIAARPFTQAGATIADQATAAALASGTAEPAPASNDVAIETLVTSRQVIVPTISGNDPTVTIPDIQMTAIRLSDAAIIGQATANDIINQLPPASLGTLGVQDALEATAFNLMADMTARAK